MKTEANLNRAQTVALIAAPLGSIAVALILYALWRRRRITKGRTTEATPLQDNLQSPKEFEDHELPIATSFSPGRWSGPPESPTPSAQQWAEQPKHQHDHHHPYNHYIDHPPAERQPEKSAASLATTEILMRGEEDHSGGPLRSNPILLMRGALPWPDSGSGGSRHYRAKGEGGGGVGAESGGRPGSAASGSLRSAQATHGASTNGSASNNSEPILAPLRHEYVSGRLRYSLSPMRYVTRLDEAHHQAAALEPSSAAILGAAPGGHEPEAGSASGLASASAPAPAPAPRSGRSASGPERSMSPAPPPPPGKQQQQRRPPGEREEGEGEGKKRRKSRHASWALARWSRERDESLDSEPSSSAGRDSDWIRPMDWGRHNAVDRS